ncbi:MAG: hypothetical protein HYW38_02145 [Candidatus Colwellbacteria bacterium]|nr:hypothetical protein [Candidatus Colwellbacteria bacterium]
MNRTDWSPPTSIEGVSFEEIYELFANSSYGEILRQAIRYAPFKPESVSNEKWVEVLGPDVSNLEHLKFTLSLTQDFLRFSANPHKEWMSRERELEELKFDSDDVEMLCLTAIIHDWGEAVVGDIPWGDKKTSHSEAELIILKRQIKELCNKRFGILISKMNMAAEVALGGENTKLGQAFNAIEMIGYGSTALKAWEQWRNFDGVLSQNLFKLAKQVAGGHLQTWQKQAEIYPGTHHWLLQNEKILKEIQEADIDWRDVPISANN